MILVPKTITKLLSRPVNIMFHSFPPSRMRADVPVDIPRTVSPVSSAWTCVQVVYRLSVLSASGRYAAARLTSSDSAYHTACRIQAHHVTNARMARTTSDHVVSYGRTNMSLFDPSQPYLPLWHKETKFATPQISPLSPITPP
jgi:hypothetical protein